ncbi:MAG: hydroxychlorobactene glucosyltransferase CruC [Candidatus Acidiferrum sp.]
MTFSSTTADDSRAPTGETKGCITCIVPARNEEEVIGSCITAVSLLPEVSEIIVVDDESTDNTAGIVVALAAQLAQPPQAPRLQLLSARSLPAGWTGKNYAAFAGAKRAKGSWLLFTDADAELLPGAAARALHVAEETGAALVSFSPEQITETWYEKALLPFVYCRLAARFSFEAVNDSNSPAAAANGQFLMIRRDVYDAIGGHASAAADVLEDVALARAVKSAGYAIWFGSGAGLVRTRMYRSWHAMWWGWKKNLYRLMGGTAWRVFREMESTIPWMAFLVILLGVKFPFALFLGVLLIIVRQINYRAELLRNQYSPSLAIYYLPAIALYAGVLWASYRAHSRGQIEWKGREYPTHLSGILR